MSNPRALWTDGWLLSITRSEHLVVLVNSLIRFLEVGIGEEPHISARSQSCPSCSSLRPVRGPPQTPRLPAQEFSTFLPVIRRREILDSGSKNSGSAGPGSVRTSRGTTAFVL